MSEIINQLEKAFSLLNKKYDLLETTTIGLREQLSRMRHFVEEVEKLDLTEVPFIALRTKAVEKVIQILGRYQLCKLCLSNVQEEKPKALINDYPNTSFPKWNKVPINVIKEHFQVLTTKFNKDGLPFLTQAQFDEFVMNVFINNSQVKNKIRINYVKTEKGFVIKRFWEFYKKCYNYNSEPKMDVYIQILVDNFEGMDFKSVKPFFNNHKSKNKWE